MKKLVTFGEIMGRLSPPGLLRVRQALPGMLECTFAGAEANVAVSYALFGGPVGLITALPDNDLASTCLSRLRGLGVDVSAVRRMAEGRLGLYFVEKGANQRPGKVIYDREGSSICIAGADVYDWDAGFEDAGCFHITGITPAVSAKAAEASLVAVKKAKSKGLQVSCDLNFRKKLWRWERGVPARELAERTIRKMLPFVDLVIANEADASDVLRIEAGKSEVEKGNLSIDGYPEVAREIVRQFPNVKQVAITLRQSHSASHNDWGGMLYESKTDRAYFAPVKNTVYQPYEIRHMVDRVGGGDSFAGALLFALSSEAYSAPEAAIQFAVAASCLAHSIEGDFNFVHRAEVEELMRGSVSGRIQR